MSTLQKILTKTLSPLGVSPDVISKIMAEAENCDIVRVSNFRVSYIDALGVSKIVEIAGENDVVVYRKFKKQFPLLTPLQMKPID